MIPVLTLLFCCWATAATAAAWTLPDLGMDFVLIPAGEFVMGSDRGDPDERPRHPVRLSRPFLMQTTEVTQGQWEAVMGTRPWEGREYVVAGADYPASYLSWHDAQAFIARLNELGRGVFRLPSEAEWEYACRAGSDREFCFGDADSLLEGHAYTAANTLERGRLFPHPVAGKRPNAWGLYDMHGNMYEWVQDWYGGAYYGVSPPVDPAGPLSGRQRVIRSGNWSHGADRARSANRRRDYPDRATLGFRVVRGVD